MKKARQPHIIDTWIDNPKRILVGGVTIGVGGYLLYRIGKHVVAHIKKKNTTARAGESLEVQQATILKAAMNPSGISWMKSFDGTNSSAILRIAPQVVDLQALIKAYRGLYQEDLLSELQSELTSSDYAKFMAIVQGNSQTKSVSPSTAYAKEQQLIVALKDLFVRSSPDASYQGAWYESSSKNNIIVKANQGAFIGYATGKQQYDSKNDVKFIEVGYQFIKTGMPDSMSSYAGKTYLFWVSSSSLYVRKFDTPQQMLSVYPQHKAEVQYKKPIGSLLGVQDLFSVPVISKTHTRIYGLQMKPVGVVEARTLLGEYLMTLNTGDTKYVKFRTIDNTERWVQGSDVVIHKPYTQLSQ